MRSVAAAIAVLFLIPVSHQIWDAYAPGRCIRNLRALDKPEVEDPLHTVVIHAADPAAEAPGPRDKARTDEPEDAFDIIAVPSEATFESLAAPRSAPPLAPRPRQSYPPPLPLRC